jgi:hypothetical protein
MIVKGANFCQVARIMHAIQEMDDITGGNQKCMGAIPNLIMTAVIKIRFI